MSTYARAAHFVDGVAGRFSDGPHADFHPGWLVDDELVFEITAEGRRQIPVDLMVVSALLMSRPMFVKLYAAQEALELAPVFGKATSRSDVWHRDIAAVLDVAPWLMHPDQGVMRRAQFEVQEMLADESMSC